MQKWFNGIAVVVLVTLAGFQYTTYDTLGWNNLRHFPNEQTSLQEAQKAQNSFCELSKRLDALEAPQTENLAIYERLQQVSVKVIGGRGTGSGVLFCRRVAGEWKTFIWTAAHVVDGLQEEDGSFGHAHIYVELRCQGELISTKESPAKVIAYSDPDTGQDLALLEVIENDFAYWSAKFAGPEIQPVGTPVIHVGCTAGLFNSVSLGIISQTDRDLFDDGMMYDQTSSMAYPGSSGGGVYTRDGKCIGLLTRGIGPGLNFIVPMRRVWAWAKEKGIEWALDRNVSVPLTRDPTGFEEKTWPQREVVLPAT